MLESCLRRIELAFVPNSRLRSEAIQVRTAEGCSRSQDIILCVTLALYSKTLFPLNADRYREALKEGQMLRMHSNVLYLQQYILLAITLPTCSSADHNLVLSIPAWRTDGWTDGPL